MKSSSIPMKTDMKSEQNGVNRQWHLLDVSEKRLGRFATEVALLLQGKHKVTFVHNRDEGDHVVVVNAAKLALTGNKYEDKQYHHYSGYPGGMKAKSFREMFEEDPRRVVEMAVYGMLPKNSLRSSMMKRLHVYSDDKHSHHNVTFTNVE
jgi:large subunit ribosomal protein L13